MVLKEYVGPAWRGKAMKDLRIFFCLTWNRDSKEVDPSPSWHERRETTLLPVAVWTSRDWSWLSATPEFVSGWQTLLFHLVLLLWSCKLHTITPTTQSMALLWCGTNTTREQIFPRAQIMNNFSMVSVVTDNLSCKEIKSHLFPATFFSLCIFSLAECSLTENKHHLLNRTALQTSISSDTWLQKSLNLLIAILFK